MGLPFGGQLAQAVEVSFDLVDDVAARAGIVGGEEVRIALRVVSRGETAHRPIHPAAQGRDRIGRLPTHHIIRIAMDRAITVGHHQRLTQRVDSQHILDQRFD